MAADGRNPRSQLPHRRRPPPPAAAAPTPHIPPDPPSQPLANPADAAARRNPLASKPRPLPPPPLLSIDGLVASSSSSSPTAAPQRDAVGGEMRCVGSSSIVYGDASAGRRDIRVEEGGERSHGAFPGVDIITEPSRWGLSIDDVTSRWKKIQPTEKIIEYLIILFVANAPAEELITFARISFLIEQAHWFYEDYFVDRFQCLKSFNLRGFTKLVFENCDFLTPFADDFDMIYSNCYGYRSCITVCGAILLNVSYTKCLFVQGWGGSWWGFPKGKQDQNEKDHMTAIREVKEEIGYDISEKLLEHHAITDVHRNKRIQLYIIGGVKEDTVFAPSTRKEIRAIGWFPIDDMDTMNISRKEVFLSSIRKWIAENVLCAAHEPPKDYSESDLIANMPSAIVVPPAMSPSPQLVVKTFVEQYYTTLLSSPESVHRFYRESSSLTRPDTSEVLAPVTTVHGQRAIDNMIMSLDYYKECTVEIMTKDAQLSQNDGVLVLVLGYLIGQDKIRREFCQSVFLCSEGSGVYFVLNDMVRFVSESQDVSKDPLLPGLGLEDILQNLQLGDAAPPPPSGHPSGVPSSIAKGGPHSSSAPYSMAMGSPHSSAPSNLHKGDPHNSGLSRMEKAETSTATRLSEPKQ